MKRKITPILILVLILSIIGISTVAYFNAQESAENVITAAEVDVSINEWADEDQTVPFPEDGVHGALPGSEITKVVEVENTGTAPAYIRMKVDKAIELKHEGEADLDLIKINIDETNWIYQDGYYYYHKALAVGESTTPLFTKVSFEKDMDNIYQSSVATVTVKVYATQVANNGDSPLTADGWPED